MWKSLSLQGWKRKDGPVFGEDSLYAKHGRPGSEVKDTCECEVLDVDLAAKHTLQNIDLRNDPSQCHTLPLKTIRRGRYHLFTLECARPRLLRIAVMLATTLRTVHSGHTDSSIVRGSN